MLRAPIDSLPQRLILILLSDYRSILQSPVPSKLIVSLLGDLDVQVEAARSALARLTHRELLVRTRAGRETGYALSPRGYQVTAQDVQRVDNFGAARPWDGTWTMALFSVEEQHRGRRNSIKSRLRTLGFAPLYDGAWIAAFATPEAAQAAMDAERVEDYDLFRASLTGVPNRLASLQQRWDTQELETAYFDFIRTFERATDVAHAGALDSRDAFILRTRMTDEWRLFPEREPDLPAEFLPHGWPLQRARGIFFCGFESLRAGAEGYVHEHEAV